ncbi:hypothetical protein FRC07_008813, partial [Ceratobasidium sp. 392]
MARALFGGAFRGLDGFGKTMEDVKVKTRTGAFLTMVWAAIILLFTIIEFIDYRRVTIDSLIMVDRSRGQKMLVKVNITFPRVPCYREVLQDYTHNMLKTRLDANGHEHPDNILNYQLHNEVEKTIKSRPAGYCGSCYGADPIEGGCCQTCESVRQAYLNQGWSFDDPNAIQQCLDEHWTQSIQEQNSEGCRISGRVRTNKVTGNLHFSPGRSYVSNKGDVHELVPYLRNGSHHDFGHYIHEFHFESERESDDEWRGTDGHSAWKKKVGVHEYALDGVTAHASEDRSTASNYMFQYFLKVVSNEFKHLDGDIVRSHQYSVTSFERDLSHGDHERDSHGTLVGHN